MRAIKAVILDWAGTTVDYGCFAPVGAFGNAFAQAGLHPTMEETRAPMGLPKRDHVAAMLKGERLRSEFVQKFGREPGDSDVDEIYARFEPALFQTLDRYVDVLPGVLETVASLKKEGIAVGSTTGYTRAMMDIVVPLAARNGYAPDCVVCPDDVENTGRPHPYMLWRNLQKLGIGDIRQVIKVGDTVADIQEGKNAGCVSLGVLVGSSMLGLNREEADGMEPAKLSQRMRQATDAYLQAGADGVMVQMEDLPAWIEKLEGEAPTWNIA